MPLEEPVLEHPVVVVELREVAAAGVRDERQHPLAGAEPPRAQRNESRSEMRIHSSTTAGSIVFGHVSLPMPSTRYGCRSSSLCAVYTEPSGSAPTIRTSGLCSLK